MPEGTRKRSLPSRVGYSYFPGTHACWFVCNLRSRDYLPTYLPIYGKTLQNYFHIWVDPQVPTYLTYLPTYRQRTQFVCVSMPRRSRAPERRQSDRQGRVAKGCALGKADRMKCGARKEADGRRSRRKIGPVTGLRAKQGAPIPDSSVESGTHSHTHNAHGHSAGQDMRLCGCRSAQPPPSMPPPPMAERGVPAPPCRLLLGRREASRRHRGAFS